MSETLVNETNTARVGWIDTAKCGAITSVVVFHVIIFLNDVGLAGTWNLVSGPLDTVQLPLFFFTAGLVAKRTLSLQFGVLMRTRVAKLVWLYALWSLMWAIVFDYVPINRESPDAAGHPLTRWLHSFVVPNESLWFIYALAAFFVVTWCTRKLPVSVQIGAAAALSIAAGSSLIEWDSGAVRKACMYFVFYVIALYGSDLVRRLAARVRWWQPTLAGAVYLALLMVAVPILGQSFPGLRLALGVVGVAAGVSVSVILARLTWMTWSQHLGKYTLQIYLAHFFIVLGCIAALHIDETGVSIAINVVLWVPIVSVAGIIGSLAFHRITRSIPGLWDLPKWAQSQPKVR